jgi:DNA repair ATPase RecN
MNYKEQQATLKQFDESFKEGVKVLAKAHAQLIAAQESEAVWKTVADKADQRRIEAEARLAEAEDLIRRGHAGWQKSQAEVERLEEQLTHFDDVHCKCVPRLKAEVDMLSKLTEDCLNVIRVYCPTYYNDAMERFNKTDKAKK